MCALPRHYLTPEEYLEMERQAETKSEYLHGEVYAMAGASPRHTLIAANAIALLVLGLKGRACSVYGSDLRILVPPTGLYTYPDVTVICGKAQFEDRQKDTLVNPTLIFEILSRSTEGYDRGEKFANYRTLESLSDYVLISLHRPFVEHYARQPDESWLLRSCEGVEAILPIPSIGCAHTLRRPAFGIRPRKPHCRINSRKRSPPPSARGSDWVRRRWRVCLRRYFSRHHGTCGSRCKRCCRAKNARTRIRSRSIDKCRS